MYIYRARRRPGSFKDHMQRTRYPWLRPFFAAEWIWEWLSYLLGNWSFLEVLDYLGTFSILLGVILYFAESGDREKQKQYQAWQVINTAQGKGGSGGRKEALQELAADHVDLVGVDVSGAFLQGVQLPRANLARASLRSADLRSGVFDRADLDYADLTSANIRNGSFVKTSLQYAMLADADLTGCNLGGADCEDTDFSRADLRNCDLKDIQWKGIKGLKLANLLSVKNAPEGFVAWALQQGAVQVESDSEWEKLIENSGAGK
ncbi:MAG: pentapeptide repeat-containing protein [Chthoniobacterales bacterium]